MLRLNRSLIADINPSSHVSESFRSLRTYIRQLGLLKGPGGQVLLFTSAESGEGKTTILSNLAVSFVQDGKKVAVVDCNLRKPGLHSVFDVEGSQGLAAYLSGYEEAKDVLVYGSLANLAVIPAGVSTVSPPDLLGSEKMAGLLTELKASFDLILLDSPQAVDYSDARILAPLSDGVVIVARHGRTKREALRKLKGLMEQTGVRILGIAMNQTK
ncbi:MULTISPECIES: CpsD/CapB family tyrosine-protein kinase [Paenibacillus]|jgi:capsular exopolysaccharide synthesis family protein|uniref:non-specific protein-tyrosine kinase n=1 Tax=Paenibacillus silagei TaxID=1670801 RepID=A0ABS4P1D5_9BACL|nr:MULTISPECIES: CpsD/CapB family tyrosine-protein kinase [Paenibacillus]ETT76169.1 tyrosine-protein kinase [Paenibacillus sp. FSL R7-277]MBP2116122.1 capsular exopolysaccharide synthesis family protein [Paenibacillus silagei]OMF98739.1 tyrosine protein kinase [Paenibacillus sp. FSL R7-0333]